MTPLRMSHVHSRTRGNHENGSESVVAASPVPRRWAGASWNRRSCAALLGGAFLLVRRSVFATERVREKLRGTNGAAARRPGRSAGVPLDAAVALCRRRAVRMGDAVAGLHGFA